jgi:transcriptional regulator with XRE-family HTH domain
MTNLKKYIQDHKKLKQVFIQRIEYLRTLYGMEKQEAADIGEISLSSYYRSIQNGKYLPVETIIRLSIRYGVSVDYVLGLSNVPKPMDESLTKISNAYNIPMDDLIKLLGLAKKP